MSEVSFGSKLAINYFATSIFKAVGPHEFVSEST